MLSTTDPIATSTGDVLVAELVHDTAHAVLRDSVRSAGRGRSRRLLFAVGEVELLVQVSAPDGDGTVDVAGRVAVGDVPLVGMPVRLETADERRAGVTERGDGFWFAARYDATCRLAFSAEDYVVRTASFRLKSPPGRATASQRP